MKLSNIKGEIVLDVIADLVAPIANIAIDEEASDLLRRKPLPEGMTVAQFTAERAKKSVPKLLKGHKDDLIEILATVSLQSKEEYKANMTIMSLIKDTLDILNDEVFGQLFISAQSQDTETSSGSVQENTGEEA